MRNDLTHIYVLLDRSGSMMSIKSDVEGGFAAFIAEQREQPGECRVTLAQFDNVYEVVYRSVPVTEVGPLVLVPRGSTALLESMGRLITEAGAELAKLPEDERPGAVIVAVMTDGRDNCPGEWTRRAIRDLVNQQTNDYSWQFLYMGADQDAIEVGASLGVSADHSVSYSRGKTHETMAATSGLVSKYRADRAVDPHAKLGGYTSEVRARVAD